MRLTVDGGPTSTTALRHELGRIPLSSIADQYYCEMKVEHSYTRGEIETEAKTAGTELHEELLPLKPASMKTMIRKIKAQELYVASIPLSATLAGVAVVGVPDAVVFVRGTPRHILELKTTKGDPTRFFPSQVVQPRLYGLLLDEMGFDCSSLKLCLFKWSRLGSTVGKERDEFLRGATQALLMDSLRDFSRHYRGSVGVQQEPYVKDQALKDLAPMVGYWLKQRDPIPSDSVGKCRACEYRDVCPSSLA